MTHLKTYDELLEELAALRKSEERYRGLIENANDLVQVIATDGRFLYVNGKWKNTLGYDDQDLAKITIFDVIHPDCLLQCRERFRQVLAGEPVDRIEFVMRTKDGRKVVVEGSSSCRCVAGQLVSVQGIFRDITGKRQAEESLARLRERHEVLLNSIGEGVLGIDCKGRHIFVNPAAARMLGYEPEELLAAVNHGTWHHSRPDGSPYPEEECPIQATCREGHSFHSDDEVFWRKDGTSFPVEYVSNPIREDGRIVGAVITFADITARRQAEEHTARLQAQLLQARKMQAIGTLAGGVAHDFNNILTAVMGNLELALLKSDPAAPNRKYLANIRQVTERAVDLIGQLLLFSRKQPMEFVAIDLNRVVRELEKMLHRIIGEDVAIRLDLDCGLKPIRGSITNMEQVILNMAVNARDAMPAGGTFTITTRNVVLSEEESAALSEEAKAGEAVCVTIADTGIGMEPEVLQHIFEPFFSTKESGKGTGLGLAVVYGIIQEHQGWLQVESEPGQGTLFKIFIPAHGKQPVQETPILVSLEECQGRGERILLVEDQEEVRQIAGSALATSGYQVTLAADAGEAKRLFTGEQGRFDLIFSDVVLPDQSGVDLVLELRTCKPGLKVLLSSGYIDDKSRLGVIHQRGLPFLAKPYAVTGLLQTVREVLDAKPAADS